MSKFPTNGTTPRAPQNIHGQPTGTSDPGAAKNTPSIVATVPAIAPKDFTGGNPAPVKSSSGDSIQQR